MPPPGPPGSYGVPVERTADRFDVRTEWPAAAVMFCGVLAVAMMFVDWQTSRFRGESVSWDGFNREVLPAAPIILVIMLVAVVASAGCALLLRRPSQLAFAAIPAFTAMLVIIIVITTLDVMIGNPVRAVGGTFEISAGAWLCLTFTILALLISLVPLGESLLAQQKQRQRQRQRQPVVPPKPAEPPQFPHAEGD